MSNRKQNRKQQKKMNIIQREEEFEKIVKRTMDKTPSPKLEETKDGEVEVVIETQPDFNIEEAKKEAAKRKLALLKKLERLEKDVNKLHYSIGDIQISEPIEKREYYREKVSSGLGDAIAVAGIMLGVGTIFWTLCEGIDNSDSTNSYIEGADPEEVEKEAINELASEYYEEPIDDGGELI